jgi:hypothetical protein
MTSFSIESTITELGKVIIKMLFVETVRRAVDEGFSIRNNGVQPF